MIKIKIETYYHDQLSEAFNDAYIYGQEGKFCIHAGADEEGEEVFLVTSEVIPEDLYETLHEELEENGEIEYGVRSIDTSYDDYEGKIYEVEIN